MGWLPGLLGLMWGGSEAGPPLLNAPDSLEDGGGEQGASKGRLEHSA